MYFHICVGQLPTPSSELQVKKSFAMVCGVRLEVVGPGVAITLRSFNKLLRCFRPFPAPVALPNSSTFATWQSTPVEGPRKDMPHTHIRLHSAYGKIAEFNPPAILHAMKNLIRCARCESPITEYERHHCSNTIVSTVAGEKEAIRHYQDNHADFEDGQA
jgi:hypothetical protein